MHNHPVRFQTSRHAFTLVELLVVIGIIAVLVSLLLPALNRVRENARQTQCASNMRQQSMAYNMYANDYKGKYPPPLPDSHWPFGAITTNFAGPAHPPASQAVLFEAKYAPEAKIFYCPSAIDTSFFSYDTYEPYWKTLQWREIYTSYPSWQNYSTPWDTLNVLPAIIAQRADRKGDRMVSSDMVTTYLGTPLSFWSNHIDPQHRNRGGNVLLNDGSVQWRPYSAMKKRFTLADVDFWF